MLRAGGALAPTILAMLGAPKSTITRMESQAANSPLKRINAPEEFADALRQNYRAYESASQQMSGFISDSKVVIACFVAGTETFVFAGASPLENEHVVVEFADPEGNTIAIGLILLGLAGHESARKSSQRRQTGSSASVPDNQEPRVIHDLSTSISSLPVDSVRWRDCLFRSEINWT